MAGRRRIQLDEDGQPTSKALSSARLSDRAIDEIIGMCRGVIADEEVNALEATALLRWIEANSEHADQWPFDVIYERVEENLSDGHLDADEARDLLSLLIDVTGGDIPIEDRVASYATALPLTTPPPPLKFEGRIFCLTGKFLFGSRAKCEAAVRERGGDPRGSVSTTTDYLVIGSMGSPQWLHSTFGTKIEAARFHDVAIVHEAHWLDHVDQTPASFSAAPRPRRKRRRTLVPGAETFVAAFRAGFLPSESEDDPARLATLAREFDMFADFENVPGYYQIVYTGRDHNLLGPWFVKLAEDADAPV